MYGRVVPASVVSPEQGLNGSAIYRVRTARIVRLVCATLSNRDAIIYARTSDVAGVIRWVKLLPPSRHAVCFAPAIIVLESLPYNAKCSINCFFDVLCLISAVVLTRI